ncbi:hypothetical protein BCD48_20730 [Pseudofrankia sp. BMG5.36]|nr:hypothetical protein BCD48_20730 [Pseudofrankia sp. BMG5.36]
MSLLGAGGIGAPLRGLLAAGDVRGCALAAVVTSRDAPAGAAALLTEGADVVVEAAGVAALGAYGPAVLAAGVDLVMCSPAALADDAVAAGLAAAAETGGSRWLVPAGAVGGLDTLRAAVRAGGPAAVRLTTTKRPEALASASDGDGDREPMVVFDGTARAAALRFPRTANVAVTLASATCGLDDVRVVVVADPAATRTRHEITADTAVGSYRFEFVNETVAGSGGRTSTLTMWSVVAVLEQLGSRPAPGPPGGAPPWPPGAHGPRPTPWPPHPTPPAS